MRTPSTGKANLTLWTGRLLFLFELSLSVPISAAIEDATGFATPGPLLAHYIVGTTGLQGLGALIVCGIGIDATLCCGMIWGFTYSGTVGCSFDESLLRGQTVNLTGPIQRNAPMFFLPRYFVDPSLSYYVAFLAAKGFQFDLFEPASFFISMVLASFVTCVAVVYTVYALAVKLGLGISFNERT